MEILGDDPYDKIKIVLYSKVKKCPFTKEE